MIETDQSNSTFKIEGNPLDTARILRAFVECNEAMQNIVLEMAEIISNSESTEEDREVAFDAMIEALFPGTSTDFLEHYHAKLQTPEGREAAAELQQEEEAFASVVRSLMKDRNVTQSELADAAGIGQPAISNILTRRCRPQRRTIVKLASALGVEPTELWPKFESGTPTR